MESRRLGAYLKENKSCDDGIISAALSRQIALERQGVYKPLGEILIEIGGLNPETLEVVLKRQGEDMLRSIPLFESLPPDSIAKIVAVAECRVFPKGETIIHEGDQGDAFYHTISGLARVYRLSEDGVEVTLNTLGPGEGFGEMSLLTGEPRSASVKAQEACSFLVISKQAFDRLVGKYPEFSLLLSKSLSGRLARGSTDLVLATSTEKAYQRFVSEQRFESAPQLVGRSKTTKKLQSKIKHAAQNDAAVLIVGEEGTERKDVAFLIHQDSRRRGAPFLVADAKSVNLGRVEGFARVRDPIRLELAQNSTLFGHAKGALSFARERRLGLLQVGDGGTLVIENIENLAAGVQTKLIDFIKHGNFLPLGSQNLLHSSIRVLATSTVDLNQQVQEGRFNEELYGLLKNQTLIVPPLRKRKKDLRQLVEHLIEYYSDQAEKSVVGFDLDVYKHIMAYDWPGNTDELRVVIRRAVNLAEKNRLTPENILIGMTPQVAGQLRFNILKLESFRQLFHSTAFPDSAQLIFAAFFIFILILGFWGSQEPTQNVSLELTWGVWEPLIVIACILAARIWCAVCPVGALSSIISRKFSLRRSIPSFIRNYGIYLGAFGLMLIFLSEAVFDMPFSPQATAFLILSILLPAAILALIYRRRAWCRFLCPLGKLVGFLSRFSLLELRANPNICNNDCSQPNCYVGGDARGGCPVFEAPFSLQSNQNCILCGNCIKNCQHHSPVINLRAPGHELWAFRRPDPTIVVLGIFIMGSQIFRGCLKVDLFHQYASAVQPPWIYFSLLIAATTIAALLFVKAMGGAIFKFINTRPQEKSGLMVYALLPLIVAFELGFHIERMIVFGGQLLPTMSRQLGFSWHILGIGMDQGFIKTIQVALVLLGVIASQSVLKRLLRSHWQASLTHLSFKQRWPAWLLGAAYVWFFVAA